MVISFAAQLIYSIVCVLNSQSWFITTTSIQSCSNFVGYEDAEESMDGKHMKKPGAANGGLVEIDGFDISKIPAHLNVPDSVWAGNNQTMPTLLKIGDITVPELRRRLMLKRQQVLKKNKYYVQQKVTY